MNPTTFEINTDVLKETRRQSFTHIRPEIAQPSTLRSPSVAVGVANDLTEIVRI